MGVAARGSLAPAGERIDHDHARPAAGTWEPIAIDLVGLISDRCGNRAASVMIRNRSGSKAAVILEAEGNSSLVEAI